MTVKLTVEVFDSLEDAQDEACFLWTDAWDVAKRGKPSLVWRDMGNGGTTGLPGVVEVPERFARLFAAAPDLLEACKQAALYCEFHRCGIKLKPQLDAAIRKAEASGEVKP